MTRVCPRLAPVPASTRRRWRTFFPWADSRHFSCPPAWVLPHVKGRGASVGFPETGFQARSHATNHRSNGGIEPLASEPFLLEKRPMSLTSRQSLHPVLLAGLAILCAVGPTRASDIPF